jgi:CRP-like cAMP-binding protein
MFGKRETKVDPALLRDIVLFRGFSDDELARVAALADRASADAGDVLLEQGRVGTECFVVLEGRAEVYAGDDHLATVGPGAPIGEMALIEHTPRTATVVASTPMDLVSFDVKHFRSLLEEMPSARQRLGQLVEERAELLRNRRAASSTEEGA